MPRAASRSVFFMLAVLAVAACETPPPATMPEITFANRPAIQLDVAQVEVAQSYQASYADPQIEHLFPEPPWDVMRGWVRDRLQPVGTMGTARVYIEQAGVRSDALARTPGVRGTLTVDQAERLTANFGMRVEIDQPGTRRGFAYSAVERSITVPEDATLAEREEIWYRLTEDTMRDLDAQLEASIRNNLATVVRR